LLQFDTISMAFDQFFVAKHAENIAKGIMRPAIGIVKPCEAQLYGKDMNAGRRPHRIDGRGLRPL
jgi:hypothetical protein